MGKNGRFLHIIKQTPFVWHVVDGTPLLYLRQVQMEPSVEFNTINLTSSSIRGRRGR